MNAKLRPLHISIPTKSPAFLKKIRLEYMNKVGANNRTKVSTHFVDSHFFCALLICTNLYLYTAAICPIYILHLCQHHPWNKSMLPKVFLNSRRWKNKKKCSEPLHGSVYGCIRGTLQKRCNTSHGLDLLVQLH